MENTQNIKILSATEMRCILSNINSLIAQHGKHLVRSIPVVMNITAEMFAVELLQRRWKI